MMVAYYVNILLLVLVKLAGKLTNIEKIKDSIYRLCLKKINKKDFR
jgi:hypothetical protein